MKNATSIPVIQQEINLKSLIKNIWKDKWIFAISIFFFLASAVVYIKMASPVYEASTSILIDPSGSNRVLGKSDNVGGGVSLIEIDKNLYNEVGILKSFSLIRQTVEDLNFDVSYYSRNWYRTKEHYGYFPFVVRLQESKPRPFGLPFVVRLLPGNKYRLTVQADEFQVWDPASGSVFEVKKDDFSFYGEFEFGEEVQHEYFSFVLDLPEYEVNQGVFSDEELSFQIVNLDGIAQHYVNGLSVNKIDLQASIFQITSEGPVINKEIAFLERLTENYVRAKLLNRNKIAASKREFVQDQLRKISDSLIKTELNLEAFKKNKRAVNLGVTAVNALDQTQALQVDRAKLEMDISYYQSLIETVESNRNSDEFVVPTAIGIEDPLISENILELKRMFDLRSQKRYYLTPDNEEMRILDSQIEQSTKLLLNNLRNAISAAQIKLNGLDSQMSRYNSVISSLPSSEKQLLALQRQSSLYENLFTYLSQELAKTDIAGAESISDTRVIDKARMLGNGPKSPNKKLLLILAFILGAFLPLVKTVFFPPAETIDRITQIIERTDIPILASIAYHNIQSKKSDSGIHRWRVKESFRDLYANLQLIESGEKCTVLGFTSVMPEEGKTFCTINTGITLAESGKKTLIIDLDLRSPSIISELDKIEGNGLANYLSGEINTFGETIRTHSEIPNLEFIPTKVANDNIHGLLSGVRLRSLIQVLKEYYDYILIDAPAVGLVSDYLLILELLDINLFVLRNGASKVSYIKEIEKIMSHANMTKGYIIFNGVKGKEQKYGYGKRYGINRESLHISESLQV